MNKKVLTGLSAACLAFGGALGLLYITCIIYPATRFSSSTRELVQNHFAGSLQQVTVAVVGLSLIVGVRAICSGVKAGWLPICLCLAGPVLCCFPIIDGATSYDRIGAAKTASGSEFHLLSSGFLDQELLIAKLLSDSAFARKYEVVAISPGELEMGYLSVVRPANDDRTPKLYLTADETLVGVSYQNVVYIAYNVPRHQIYSALPRSNAESSISELSPFILLENSEPANADFKDLLDVKNIGRPKRTAIQQDLKSANSRVREMARQLDASLESHPSDADL